MMLKGSVSRFNLRQIEGLFHAGIAGDLSDSELLERFLRHSDSIGEAAFEALVDRHGPMVFRVCLQALNDRHAAEDAVQVTFLVLARQAGTIRKRPSVSSWLFGVALRAAARIRMEEARRRLYEMRSAERSAALIRARQEPRDSDDPYPELHAEIDRLPEKYRVPIVLCYFEGLSHEQAASRLRWPVGTVKIRLTRARAILRARLERRGRAYELLFPAAALRAGHSAALPEHLFNTITQAACRSATKRTAVGLVSSSVVNVTQGVMQSMLFDKLKVVAVGLSGLFLLGFGGLIAGQQVKENGPTPPSRDRATAEKPDSPSTLRFVGTTDYDPARVTVVHAPFDSRVDVVLVDLGSTVKKGGPLLEIFSADLAEAKSNYETATSQWAHDKNVLEYKTPLAQANTLPTKELMDARNKEAQSRLNKKLARDKLLVYGLTDSEIENASKEDGVQKARMTLRSRADGVVVQRNAIKGNYYTTADALMTIAQLDHLWVRGSMSESESDKVAIGQKVTVRFPFDDRQIDARVEYIDAQVDEQTHTVKFRTTIPNPEGRLKAGMFVRMAVESPASEGRIDDARRQRERAIDATPNDRLSELERKMDRLLGEKEERLSHAKILDRLDALERKLDELLGGRR
jgi:RND family efflux transporter MFP subunit